LEHKSGLSRGSQLDQCSREIGVEKLSHSFFCRGTKKKRGAGPAKNFGCPQPRNRPWRPGRKKGNSNRKTIGEGGKTLLEVFVPAFSRDPGVRGYNRAGHSHGPKEKRRKKRKAGGQGGGGDHFISQIKNRRKEKKRKNPSRGGGEGFNSTVRVPRVGRGTRGNLAGKKKKNGKADFYSSGTLKGGKNWATRRDVWKNGPRETGRSKRNSENGGRITLIMERRGREPFSHGAG